MTANTPPSVENPKTAFQRIVRSLLKGDVVQTLKMTDISAESGLSINTIIQTVRRNPDFFTDVNELGGRMIGIREEFHLLAVHHLDDLVRMPQIIENVTDFFVYSVKGMEHIRIYRRGAEVLDIPGRAVDVDVENIRSVRAEQTVQYYDLQRTGSGRKIAVISRGKRHVIASL